MKKLMVFDLQKFALHDGPGIRTTVFLKGCPLNCLWCHNPESKKCGKQLGFLEKNCSYCGECERICQRGVHKITGKNHKIEESACIHCGKCEEVCLSHAIKIYGSQMSIEEILDTVMKDEDFFRRSGGGLTVSGGEPMLQYEGLLSLLQEAKKRGLHVCLDTCGQADTEKYREIAQYVDLFLFDYKVTGEKLHKKYTGVDNRTILKNLDFLCRNGSEVWLRCPVIPGINDTAEHYLAIAELSGKYDSIKKVNLMTYHDMAKGKAEQIGENYELSGIKTVDSKGKDRIYHEAEAFGCLKLERN